MPDSTNQPPCTDLQLAICDCMPCIMSTYPPRVASRFLGHHRRLPTHTHTHTHTDTQQSHCHSSNKRDDLVVVKYPWLVKKRNKRDSPRTKKTLIGHHHRRTGRKTMASCCRSAVVDLQPTTFESKERKKIIVFISLRRHCEESSFPSFSLCLCLSSYYKKWTSVSG